jgi:pimeloyl-ACP methyl ester carboxylesterase
VKILKILLFFIILLAIVGFMGPKVTFEPATILDTEINVPIQSLEDYVKSKEFKTEDIKPGNEAKIVWANDSFQQKTPYSVVYLHGFSASHEEGAPIHRDFAKRYGCNLYLARLEDHGRSYDDTFKTLTPDNFIQSAEDAIDIGKILGEKVIVISCSTGGTLSAILAATGEDTHSMIMYSPNIDIYDTNSELLLYPWGKQLSSLVMGGEYNRINYTPDQQKYWNSVYHTNGLFALKTIIKDYMHEETFQKIKVPVFMGYYYKDEENQDKVVSVSRMLDFYNQIGTPADQKHKVAFPTAGHHVISSYLMNENINLVANETYQWAEKVLGLKPI